MPLEAGSVFIKIAGLFDKSEFDKADRVVAAQRVAAKDPITYHINVDQSGLDRGLLEARAKAAAAGAGGGVGGGGLGIPGIGTGGGLPSPTQPDRAGGGGGDGRGLGSLLWRAGGPFGLGGFSLGTVLGLGPEHLFGSAASVAGSAAGGLLGGGLVAAGAGGVLAAGAGSDLAVTKTTVTNTTALAQAYDKLDQAVAGYGKNSTQAAAAQKNVNAQQAIAADQVGPKAAKAEEQLAKQVGALGDQWQKQTAQAQISSTKILEQVVHLGSTFTPLIANAAKRNLDIVNTGLKPLFAWLEGPQGKGIFTDLENRFAKTLPTSIHAFTQAIELFLRIIDKASQHTGNLSTTLDNFFSRKNAESAAQLGQWVDKWVGKFDLWLGLIKDVARTFIDFVHTGAGEGDKLVKMLDTAVKHFNDWIKSAQGNQTLHNFFVNRAAEMNQIVGIVGSIVKIFGQWYFAMQPLVPLVTAVLGAVRGVAQWIADLGQHSAVFRDAFVVPLGTFLLAWQTFGWDKTINGIKSIAAGLGLINKAEVENATLTEARSGGGMLSRLVSKLPGGSIISKFLPGGGTGGMGIGGATGLGPPGSKTNPIVTVGTAAENFGIPKETVPGEGGGGGLLSRVKGFFSKGTPGAVGGAAENVGTAAEGLGTAAVGAEAGAGAVEAGIGAAIIGALPIALPAAGIAAAIGGAIFAGIKLFGGGGPESLAQKQATAATQAFGAGGLQARQQGQTLLQQAQGQQGSGAVNFNKYLQLTGPTQAELKSSAEKYTEAGKVFGTQLINGWNQYAHINESTMFEQFFTTFKKQNPRVQAAGAELALNYALGLQKEGKLPVGSVQDFMNQIEQVFPGVVKFIGKSAQNLAAAVTQMVAGMKTALSGLISGPNSFADVADIVTAKGVTVQQKWGLSMSQLELDTASTVKGTRVAANAQLTQMVQFFISSGTAIKTTLTSGSQVAKDNIIANIKTAINVVKLQMAEGLISTKQGQKEITHLTDLLNTNARAIRNQASSLANIANASGFGTTGAGATPRGVANIGGVGGARGGYLPGHEFGYGDRMRLIDPMGRERARLAGDETVYNRWQQPYVEQGLRAIGFSRGSEDLWQQVNRPHGFATGGAMGFATGGALPRARTHPQKTPQHSAYLTSAAARALGLQGLVRVDNEVAALDTKFTTQDNIFQLYNPTGGPLPLNELNIEMAIRNKQFGLLWDEWGKLPAALRSLERTVYGPTVGTGAGAHTVGGVDRAVHDLQGQINTLDTQIAGDQQAQIRVTGQTQTSSNQNAAAVSGILTQLNTIHNENLNITNQISSLQMQLKTSGPTSGSIETRINRLKAQRLYNQGKANTLQNQLAALRRNKATVVSRAAAERYQLTSKLAALRTTLANLKKALAAEIKTQTQDNTALNNLRARVHGDPTSGQVSILQEMSDYGYDILALWQQGASLSPHRLNEIKEVYKKLGIALPADMSGGPSGTVQASQAVAQLQAFQQSLLNTIIQFGGNYVPGGQSVFSTAAGTYAGIQNYGAAGGRAMGGRLGDPIIASPTPYGGGNKTEINITQHFARGPAEPHSYSNGLKWELEAAF